MGLISIEERIYMYIGNRLCWMEWSCDWWRHATVWRHSGDNAAHIIITGLSLSKLAEKK